MKSLLTLLSLFFVALATSPVAAQGRTTKPLFDMAAMLDESTLKIDILQDWHPVNGPVPTRQKLISIEVGELLPGRSYRIPVRMIVPANRKAKGFHLTGGHNQDNIQRDARPRGVDLDLLRGGVGLVYTIVQVLQQSGQGELGRAADREFFRTLNPHYSIQYWGWPATLMRATTAAYAEREHFEKGKVALSGGSKNGASPSVSLIHDKRMTAVHATVSPIWDSPLRLCDRQAWDALNRENQRYLQEQRRRDPRVNAQRILNHFFLGGTYGPVYNKPAMAAGNSWKDLQNLAQRMADNVFISRNLEALKKRNVDLLFHPGTHDFVNFDIAWGGANHPTIPVYLSANSGHSQRGEHPGTERAQQNKSAFMLNHFFDDVPPLLKPPTVTTKRTGRQLEVTIKFADGVRAESGRIWWIYNRAPDGSAAYLAETFPADQWKEMKSVAGGNTWTTTIELASNKARIDFFSSHRKTIRYRGRPFPSFISCPYTRVELRTR